MYNICFSSLVESHFELFPASPPLNVVPVLSRLNLSGCSLTDDALVALAELVPGLLTDLISLTLSNNEKLTAEGAVSFYRSVGGKGKISKETRGRRGRGRRGPYIARIYIFIISAFVSISTFNKGLPDMVFEIVKFGKVSASNNNNNNNNNDE